jgi:DNA-binding LacI/PurR family transcriptional regulator
MATTAVELLIEQIEAKSKLRRVKRFPGELIIRRSSAAPSNPRKLASTG